MTPPGSRAESLHGATAVIGLIVRGPLADLDALARDVETRSNLRLIFVRTSVGRLWIKSGEPPEGEL
jgi:hypothetical protein